MMNNEQGNINSDETKVVNEDTGNISFDEHDINQAYKKFSELMYRTISELIYSKVPYVIAKNIVTDSILKYSSVLHNEKKDLSEEELAIAYIENAEEMCTHVSLFLQEAKKTIRQKNKPYINNLEKDYCNYDSLVLADRVYKEDILTIIKNLEVNLEKSRTIDKTLEEKNNEEQMSKKDKKVNLASIFDEDSFQAGSSRRIK